MIQEAIKQEEERKKPQSSLLNFSFKRILNFYILKNLVDEVMKFAKYGMKKILQVDHFHYVFYPVN